MKKTVIHILLLLISIVGKCQTATYNNASLSLDGIDDYGLIANPFFSNINQRDFTIEFYAKLNSAQTQYAGIWGKTGFWSEINVELYNTNKIEFFYATLTGGTQYFYSDTVSFIANQWEHYAVVGDGTNNQIRIYKNGVLKGTKTQGTPDWSLPNNDSKIGAVFQGWVTPHIQYLKGKLDDFRVSKIARYTSNFIPPQNLTVDANTVVMYDFNSVTSNIVSDLSGNNNNLTLVNGALIGSTDVPYGSCLPTISTTNITICPTALPYTWNGKTLSSSGVLKDTLTNAAGCDSIATLNLAVITQPTQPANNVCVGGTLQLTNAQQGGVWSSATASLATVSATGLVTAKWQGNAIINYKLPSGVKTIYNIKVNALPNAPSMAYAAGTADPQYGAGTGNFCVNKTFGVVGNPIGGVFSSTNSSVLSVNCNNIVNTAGLGTATLMYTYTNTLGCSNNRSVAIKTVNCVGHRGVTNNLVKTNNDFILYPNPAQSSFNINIETLVGAGSIVVTDLYGKQAKTQTLSMGNNRVDISNLNRGFYFVSIITNEGKKTKKLVVE